MGDDSFALRKASYVFKTFLFALVVGAAPPSPFACVQTHGREPLIRNYFEFGDLLCLQILTMVRIN